MTTVSIQVPQFVFDALAAVLPAAYIDWWVTLLRENPTHLYIETTLVSYKSFVQSLSSFWGSGWVAPSIIWQKRKNVLNCRWRSEKEACCVDALHHF